MLFIIIFMMFDKVDEKKLRALTEAEINLIVEDSYAPAKNAGVFLLFLSAMIYLPVGMLLGWLIWG